MKDVLLVGLGGGLGSIARFLCQRWLYSVYPHPFPIGTFLVNLAGCFLIGLFWGISMKSPGNSESWKLFLMTGVCGGYTTFSTFTFESIGLMKENKYDLFLLYIGCSVVMCLLATWAGLKLVRL